MNPVNWRFTLINSIHPAVSERIRMQSGELPIVSCYISDRSWYLFTTRRTVGAYGGQQVEVVPTCVHDYHFGNFKGYHGEETNVMTLVSAEGREVQLEYETGAASMAPIHYLLFWRTKYRVLDKLRFPPRCPYCGKLLRTLLAQQCLHCGADWHGKESPI